MYNSILIIGTGQIGKAILQKILDKEPKKITIHLLVVGDNHCKIY